MIPYYSFYVFYGDKKRDVDIRNNIHVDYTCRHVDWGDGTQHEMVQSNILLMQFDTDCVAILVKYIV